MLANIKSYTLFGKGGIPKKSEESPKINKFLEQSKSKLEYLIIVDESGKNFMNVNFSHKDLVLDESLIAMFLSAISSFSHEIFQEKASSILVNHKDKGIAIRSNESFCIGIIGSKITTSIDPHLNEILKFVSNFIHVKNGEINKSDENHLLIKIKSELKGYLTV